MAFKLLQPLQARVFGVQLEGLFEEVGTTRFESVRYCQPEHMRRRILGQLAGPCSEQS